MMALPYLTQVNPNPFTLDSLRQDQVFLGVLPTDQQVLRGLLGNSVESMASGLVK